MNMREREREFNDIVGRMNRVYIHTLIALPGMKGA